MTYNVFGGMLNPAQPNPTLMDTVSCHGYDYFCCRCFQISFNWQHWLMLTVCVFDTVALTALVIARDVCLMTGGFYIRYVSLPHPVSLSLVWLTGHYVLSLSFSSYFLLSMSNLWRCWVSSNFAACLMVEQVFNIWSLIWWLQMGPPKNKNLV